MRSKIFLKSSLVLLLIFLCGGIIIALSGTVDNLSIWLENKRLMFTIVRILLITSAIVFYNTLATWYSRISRFDEHKTKVLINSREKIIVWLILLELIVGQNVLGEFVDIIKRFIQ